MCFYKSQPETSGLKKQWSEQERKNTAGEGRMRDHGKETFKWSEEPCSLRMFNSKWTWVSLLVALEQGNVVKYVPHTLREEITVLAPKESLSISTWLHFLGRSVILMDILHREWVQQSQARGRTPCSSTFRLKQTFGQEWTSKLTHWVLLLFPRVQTFVGFSTLAGFFFSCCLKGCHHSWGKPISTSVLAFCCKTW